MRRPDEFSDVCKDLEFLYNQMLGAVKTLQELGHTEKTNSLIEAEVLFDRTIAEALQNEYLETGEKIYLSSEIVTKKQELMGSFKFDNR